MITPRTALAGGGGLLAAIAFVLGGAVGDSTDLVSPAPQEEVIIVAPASPGLTSAGVICARGFPSRRPDGGYFLLFGLSSISASPQFGHDFPLAIVDGEPVTLSREVVDCLLGRFR